MFHKSKRVLALLLCTVLTFSLLAVPTPADALGAVECTNPNGHKFIQVIETNPESVGYKPECPNTTVYQLKCEYCSAERGYYGGNHAWSGWTENGDGTRSRYCTQCGAQETGSGTETSHTHTLRTVTVAATCTKDGYSYERCTKCDYEGPRTVLPATGHNPVDDDDCRTPPRCTVCGELLWDGKTYPAIHNFGGAYEYDENGHWQHCQNEGCSAISAVSRHRTTGGVGDCTRGETCSECGATVAMGREHNFENAKVGIINATGHFLICTNPGCGMTQFFSHSFSGGKCTVCGQVDPNYQPSEQQGNQVAQTKKEEQKPSAGQETPAAQEEPAVQELPAAQVATVAQAPQEKHPDVVSKFSDVAAGKWYTGDIQRVVDAGLMSGMTDSTFGPDANVNRAMLATLLYRLEGEPSASGASFSDVKSTAYYADAVSWAAEKGIVTGYGNGSFQPKQDITRQELVTALYRYAKQAGYNPVSKASLDTFTDWNEVAPWAYEAMAWAYQVGIFNGRSGNLLAPTATATRAEVATMIVRFMDLTGAQ